MSPDGEWEHLHLLREIRTFLRYIVYMLAFGVIWLIDDSVIPRAAKSWGVSEDTAWWVSYGLFLVGAWLYNRQAEKRS